MARRRQPPGWDRADDGDRERYGAEHRALRKTWAQRVQAGAVSCWRCGEWIPPGSRWHLGHSDDGSTYMGPEHPRCNIRAASKEAHRRRRGVKPLPQPPRGVTRLEW